MSNLAKRINAQIKELAAIEGGKVNMDAPMFRATLKAIARLGANQALQSIARSKGSIEILDLLQELVEKEVRSSINPKRPKRPKRK